MHLIILLRSSLITISTNFSNPPFGLTANLCPAKDNIFLSTIESPIA